MHPADAPTYGVDTKAVTKKYTINLGTMQGLVFSLRDKIRNEEIRIMKGPLPLRIAELKRQWVGHVARLKMGRWVSTLVQHWSLYSSSYCIVSLWRLTIQLTIITRYTAALKMSDDFLLRPCRRLLSQEFCLLPIVIPLWIFSSMINRSSSCLSPLIFCPIYLGLRSLIASALCFLQSVENFSVSYSFNPGYA